MVWVQNLCHCRKNEKYSNNVVGVRRDISCNGWITLGEVINTQDMSS
jgi:hypothetical protein